MSPTRRSWNPIKFLSPQVTIICSLAYIAVFTSLLYVDRVLPAVPSSQTPVDGVNLTQAWLDLEFISDGYHPWSSRRNERVREYLLGRIESILEESDVAHKTVYSVNNTFTSSTEGPKLVTVFANDTSNFTAWDDWTKRPWTLYGESSNILVYIRGEDDRKDDDWWNGTTTYDGKSGVLVNAHYDSVSSGLGATDDGVGVITVLQLISHFARNRPKRGLVALLNNGEEMGLYGARNYVRHPLSQFPHTFLNLEGAGAGGRATLFRSTDAEVTRAYSKSPNPFGSVVSGDGFRRGFIRSGTDYSVFTEELGLRGLDVAFFEPRARYHTDQDDSRNTSPESVWHMLSASLATVRALTSHEGDDFEGQTRSNGKINSGTGSDAFWFDLFGQAFAVGKLTTLFALSITLLVAGPIIFILLEVLLRKSDKWYPFAGKKYLHSADDDDAVRIHGRRGFFRFVLAFVVATAVVVALAYLVTKVNPFIIYSSPFAVWIMMLSAWLTIAWFLLAGAHNIRPTALHRMYVVLWLYILTWVLLVVATIGENNLHLASGYFMVVYNASAFLALLISYLDLFALPKIHKYVEHVLGAQATAASTRRGSQSSRRLLEGAEHDEGEATERTSLLRHDGHSGHQTFTGLGRKRADRDEVPEDTDDPFLNKAYEHEQAWSSSLPQWTWLLQFLLLAVNVIIVGQLALLLTSALHQTPADGNSPLPTYLFVAALSVLILLPLIPFLHRFSYHVPTFLLLVFIGCLVYNLVAFPFSREARMKYYFVQQMDLQTGANNVSVIGLDDFVQDVISEMPSAAGQPWHCGDSSAPRREGLTGCSWSGLPPNVVPRGYGAVLSRNTTRPPTYKDWLHFNSTRNGSSATFYLQGINTKECRLQFDTPVSDLQIEDGAVDPRQQRVPEGGSSEIRLVSRTFDKTFVVHVSWLGAPAKGQKGRAVCSWDDANRLGSIPAFDELKRFEPVWSTVSKTADGLLEGFKEFQV